MIPLLLSKRAVARLLALGRDTITALIRDGHLRTVEVQGRVKIALAEVERFTREGTGQAPVQVRASRRNRSRCADGIRAIVIT